MDIYMACITDSCSYTDLALGAYDIPMTTNIEQTRCATGFSEEDAMKQISESSSKWFHPFTGILCTNGDIKTVNLSKLTGGWFLKLFARQP